MAAGNHDRMVTVGPIDGGIASLHICLHFEITKLKLRPNGEAPMSVRRTLPVIVGRVDDTLAREVAELRERIEAAEALLAIQRLKGRYAELVDRRFRRGQMIDAPALDELAGAIAELFTEDGLWDGGPVHGVAHGRDEIATRMRTSTLAFSRHLFLAPQIDVDGEYATGRWELLSPCTTSDGTSHWMSGYQDDEYRRDSAGGWRFQRIKLTTVFVAPASKGWRCIDD
jgi:hypothetical protein